MSHLPRRLLLGLMTAAMASLLAASLAGCKGVEPPQSTPAITGTVQDVATPATRGAMLAMHVEGQPVREPFGSADVWVNAGTPVLVGNRDRAQLSPLGIIGEGDEVMVWFSRCWFSCPVEGDASLVLVLERG